MNICQHISVLDTINFFLKQDVMVDFKCQLHGVYVCGNVHVSAVVCGGQNKGVDHLVL